MLCSISGREVPITPSGSITWESVGLPEGTLYLPTEGDNLEVGRLLQSGAVGDLIASGKSGGNVYEAPTGSDPGLVIKEFTPRIICNEDTADRGGISSLRANVMLAAGLNALEQRRGAWRIEGVPILGALVMHEGAKDPTIHARWIMRKISHAGQYASDFMPVVSQQMMVDSKGNAQIKYGRTIKPGHRPLMPSPKKRHNLYEEAMTAANGSPIASSGLVAHYDDHPGNMILESLPVMNGRKAVKQGQAIKLDVQPFQGFDF